MTADFAPVDFQSIVGVIDLKLGNAVAASGGHRDHYEPISSIDGDSDRLIKHYTSLGIHRTYIADLDAIVHDRPQIENLRSLVCGARHPLQASVAGEFWIDTGIRTAISPWMLEPEFKTVSWIVASETCRQVGNFHRIAESASIQKIAISLDFQGSRFLGEHFAEWIELLSNEMVSSVIVLNLSDVGSQCGGSMDDVIVEIRNRYPNLRLLAGGGVRNGKDLRRLKSLGCDDVLVATAIRP
jgi:phosphoribosylformimino-5-aminoimidazole carboxamide ribotide isomerase